jgi:alkylation response protein AidB-like acyl-CoA dehydrogenase
MWITNGGFADVMIVFAKIDDDENLTAFIVDGHAEGISKNPSEPPRVLARIPCNMPMRGNSLVAPFRSTVQFGTS